MKTFTLKDLKFKPHPIVKLEVGKTYETRGGRKVEIIALNTQQLLGGPVLGVVHFGHLPEVFNFYEDGKFLGDKSESTLDIVREAKHLANCLGFICSCKGRKK